MHVDQLSDFCIKHSYRIIDIGSEVVLRIFNKIHSGHCVLLKKNVLVVVKHEIVLFYSTGIIKYLQPTGSLDCFYKGCTPVFR